jgi:hypothetical protein
MADYYSTPLNSLLRKPPPGLARSAYAVEINPWVPRGNIEAALLFRGTIVSAFGYIETLMGEVAVRASRLDDYAGLREGFPHSAAKRSAHLRRVFASGPLAPFERLATLAFDRFDATAELRHLVAHARMQVLPDWGVTFEDFPRNAPGGLIKRTKRLQMSELEQAAWQAARLSRLCQRLAGRLNAVLPPL